jgi:hypothetical protein
VLAVSFVEEAGRTVAVLANYACHPVSMGWQSRAISGDFFGIAAGVVSDSISAPVLITNGACGDLDPPTLSDDFEMCKGYAETLARGILEGLSNARPIKAELHSGLAEVVIPTERLSDAEIGTRAAEVAMAAGSESGLWPDAMRRSAQAWKHAMQGGRMEAPLPLTLQSIFIGNMAFVAFGAEVLSQMKGDLREALGPNVWPVGYANGTLGYLAPKKAFEEGGYEVDLAYVYYGTPKLSPGSYEVALEEAVLLAKQTIAT